MTATKTAQRGPSGSVRGIPEDDVTVMLVDVVTEVAKTSLDFQRIDAREILEQFGVPERLLDGYLFSLHRTIPGIVSTGYGTYRLPENWEVATKSRMWRFKVPLLNVLDAQALYGWLATEDELSDNLTDLRRRLGSELDAL